MTTNKIEATRAEINKLINERLTAKKTGSLSVKGIEKLTKRIEAAKAKLMVLLTD